MRPPGHHCYYRGRMNVVNAAHTPSRKPPLLILGPEKKTEHEDHTALPPQQHRGGRAVNQSYSEFLEANAAR